MMRPMLSPWEPSGMAQPMITSSMSAASSPSARRTAFLHRGGAHVFGTVVGQGPLLGATDSGTRG